MDNEAESNKKLAREITGPRANDVTIHSDEIDLVDLWIFFWDQRKLFLISVILASVLGIAGFETVYATNPRATVRSLIETPIVSVAEGVKRTSYTLAFAGRIEFADLPRYASVEDFSHIKPYLLSSSITAIKNTNLIEIVTEAPPDAVADVSQFHNWFTAQIVSDVTSSSSALIDQADNQISSINEGITRLRTLVYGLERGLQREGGGIALSNQVSEIQITAKLDELRAEIDVMSENVKSLGPNFWRLNPRVLVVASVSEQTTGIKKSTAYSLIILLAIFLAIFVVIINSFVARVKERMASRS